MKISMKCTLSKFEGYDYISGKCFVSIFLQYIWKTFSLIRRNIMCGTLQCQQGMGHPVSPNTDQSYSRTIVAMGGHEYECKLVMLHFD